MLDFILSLVAIFGMITLIITGLFYYRYFFLVLFIVKPFIDMTVNTKLIGDFNALEISGIFIALILLYKYFNRNQNYPTYNEGLIWLFIFLQIISFLFNASTDAAKIISQLKIYLKITSSYLIYFLAAKEIIENYNKRVNLVKAIWITSLFAGVITIMVYALGLSNYDTTRGVVRYNGLYNDPGTPSYLSIICLLFCNLYFKLSKGRHLRIYNILRIATYAITGIIIVITLTKSALLMLFVYIILWYGIFEKRTMLVLPALILSVYISFSLSQDLNTRFETEIDYIDSGGDADVAKSMGTGRINRWETLIHMYFEELDIGHQLIGTSRNWMAHNQYLAYLLQVGAIGLIVFLAIIIRFIVRLSTIYHRTGNPSIFAALTLLLMYATYAFTGHPFDYTTLLWYLMILLSMVNVYDISREKKMRSKNLARIKLNQIEGQNLN
ncbi:MAG TPA: hypothetical protein P5162_11750 [Bacteroidia bacterium]|nr:hypothetical protein [Bacteroidota bacterium]MCB8930105.1 hypothetical protein [Bacteroidia bacterium]MCW5931003.1 hypothetical protein [Bacteroidota bacterium]HRV53752.1 hypothetical protein [Bacteroidia bacterium]